MKQQESRLNQQIQPQNDLINTDAEQGRTGQVLYESKVVLRFVP